MKTNYLKLLLPLVILFETTNIFSQWYVTGSPDDYTVDAYCQVVDVHFQITNTGAAGNMTGVLEYNSLEYEVVEYSGLPSAVWNTNDPYNYKLTFDAGLIGGSSPTKHFYYKIILKPYVAGDHYEFYNRAFFDSDDTDVKTWELILTANTEAWPIYGNALVSDIMDQIEIDNVVVSLLPLEPLEPTEPERYACNPDYYQSIFIEDRLTFDIPEYCLHNNTLEEGIIIMGSGSEIVVEDGATLIIDGLSVGSCHEMWKGIRVKSGGTLRLNVCTIVNAQYGIRAEKGAKVSVHRTEFLDNYIGIYIPPTSSPGTVGLGVSYSHFKGSGEMLDPYFNQTPLPTEKPFAGIYASDLLYLGIHGSDVGPAHQISGNHFKNLTNGIIARNSNTYIGDQTFTNILPDPDININDNDPTNIANYEGYGILTLNCHISSIHGNVIGPGGGYNAHFDNCHVGIHSMGGHTTINGMTMVEVTNGIELSGAVSHTIKVIENTISAKSIGILSNQNIPYKGKIHSNTISVDDDITFSTGIELNDVPVDTRWDIKENTIYVQDGLNGIHNKAGNALNIHNNTIDVTPLNGAAEANAINLMGTKWPRVTCNLLGGDIDLEVNNRLGAGINIDGSNSFILGCNTIEKFKYGIKTSSESMGDNFIQGNILNNHWAGLYYGFSAVTGRQDHRGNVWDGNFSFKGAVHTGELNTVLKSRYFYDTGDNTLFEPPTVSSASTSWFTGVSGNSFFCELDQNNYCAEGIGSGAWTPSWDSLDLELATQNLGLTKFDNSLTWKSRFWIYRRLRESGSLPTGLSSFISNNATSNIGLFSNAHDSLARAFIYSGNLEYILEEYPNEMDRIFTDIAYFDSLIIKGFNSDSLNILIQAKYDTIYILESDYDTKDATIRSSLALRHQNAIDYIESIQTDSIWEDALKFTLLEYLITSEDDTLVNSTDIYNLAISCPDMYGDAVYYARSLIRKDSLINYFDDDSECAFLAPRSSQENINNAKIFPNPGSHFVEIQSDREIAEIEVYDLSGLSLSIPITINSTLAFLNTMSLSSGVYVVRIKSNRAEIQVLKMIIIN